ncbi:MAG: BatA domain-containing protein [Verrucomicrobiota bacterium]|nr:BatA domain-containing protein [Verrucomicrobiota bacterium]
MSFLNPALLMGAFALAIPIIVHLLNRRRFKRIKWAAMRFLEVSLERNQRRMKVEDWILLLLRLAIVALIVLALSRPASNWIKSTGLGSTVAASIIVDSSASMQRIDQDCTLTRFQIAKNTAIKALDSTPKGSSSSVLFAANSQGLGIKEPSHDKKRITNTINEAKSSDRGSDLFPAIQASINSLNNSPSTQRELIIITDGEASAWKQFESISRTLNENKENIKTTIALVGNAPNENIAITSLSQKTPIVSVGQPMRLSVGVTNFG